MLEAKLFQIRNERLSGDISDNPLPLITNKYYRDVREGGAGCDVPNHSLSPDAGRREEKRAAPLQGSECGGKPIKKLLRRQPGYQLLCYSSKINSLIDVWD